MPTLKVGDTVGLCASIYDFCGVQNFYVIRDINASTLPCTITAGSFNGCLPISGVNLEFQWTNASGSVAKVTCEPASAIKVLGTASTNSQGVASLVYTITQEDLNLYTANSALFDLRVCIRNPNINPSSFSDVRKTFQTADPDIIIAQSEVTHTLDIIIKPYPWYTPDGAAAYLITKIADLNGMIINWLTGLTGWTYIKTDIITENENVIIRVSLKSDTIPVSEYMDGTPVMKTAAVQLGAAELIILVAALGVIFIGIGIISGWKLSDLLGGGKNEKQFSPEEVVKIIFGDPNNPSAPAITPAQLDECDKNVTAGDAAALKICYDSVIQGACNGIIAALKDKGIDVSGYVCPDISTLTQSCLDQYLIDSDWTAYQQCMRDINKTTGTEVLEALPEPQPEPCWIPNPVGGCLLTATTGKTVALIGAAVVGLAIVYKVATRR